MATRNETNETTSAICEYMQHEIGLDADAGFDGGEFSSAGHHEAISDLSPCGTCSECLPADIDFAAAEPTIAKKKGAKKAAPKKAAKAKKTAPVAKVEAETNPDGNATIIGHKVWWDLEGASDDRGKLETLLTNAGLEWAMPSELSFEQRVRQAGTKAGRGFGVDLKSAGRHDEFTTYRPIKTKRTVDTAAAVNDEHKLSVDPTVLSAITVNRETGAVTLGDPTCEVGQAVAQAYADLDGKFTPPQLRQVIKAVLEGELHGMRLSRRGGFYYIPGDVDVTQTLTGLQTIVQSIGTSELYIEDVVRGSDTARSASRGTMRTLDGLYSGLFADAQAFVKTLQSGDLANGRSLSTRLEQATSLKRQAALYLDILDERGKALAMAASTVGDVVQDIVKASVEVRSLQKAKDSEVAQRVAKEMMVEIATKATDALLSAAEGHAPTTNDDSDDSE